jgi:hypothetical protein
MPAKNDLTFDLGEDWVINLTCHQADAVTPLDITGATLTMAISGVTGFAPSVTVTDGPNGKVTIRATPAQQNAAAALAGGGLFGYTIRATLTNGLVSDQSAGVLRVRKPEF